MHKLSFFFLIIFLFLAPPIYAFTPFNTSIKNNKKIEKTCLYFTDSQSLDFQKQQWKTWLDSQNENEVLLWISGQKKPPSFVRKTVKKQLRCLFRKMILDAVEKNSTLQLQTHRRHRKANRAKMKRLFKKVQSSRGIRAFEKNTIRSSYRSASTQASIWKRKFYFHGKNFNIISARSAKRCSLHAGDTWKPKLKYHRKCWKKMADEEKEQEILLASSAPGISRHHWGTDIDIFGLNPRSFINNEKNADEYQWLKQHAISLGFFQPYSEKRSSKKLGYMNERWHWSYYPIAGALSDYAFDHRDALEKIYNILWKKKKKKSQDPYSFIRKNWQSFVFNIENPLE